MGGHQIDGGPYFRLSSPDSAHASDLELQTGREGSAARGLGGGGAWKGGSLTSSSQATLHLGSDHHHHGGHEKAVALLPMHRWWRAGEGWMGDTSCCRNSQAVVAGIMYALSSGALVLLNKKVGGTAAGVGMVWDASPSAL